MLISAKADYAVRAVVELAAADADGWLSAEAIAARQGIPKPFLIKILQHLRVAGLTEATRGSDGGHRLAHSPAEISIGDVMRAVDGPLANVHGVNSPHINSKGPAGPVACLWAELQRRVDDLIENVSVADILADEVPLSSIDLGRVPIV